jgi:glutaconate CoA-transferase subunit A
MQSKLTSMPEALAAVQPGSAVALGGATLRRKPMALVRELVAQRPSDLDLWTWIGSLDVDMLVGAGAVRSVNSAYIGFGAFGLAQTTRRAFVDRSVAFTDWTESSLVASFRAGASGLPMALTRALNGTSMAEELGRPVESFFGGPPVMAVPSAQPDVALIHAQSADEFGNVRRRRPWVNDDIDHVIAASARTVIVSVEELDTHEDVVSNRDEVVIPGHHVTSVCLAPRGAHPTGCDGYYHPDGDAVRAYAAASKTPEGMAEYLQSNIYTGDAS